MYALSPHTELMVVRVEAMSHDLKTGLFGISKKSIVCLRGTVYYTSTDTDTDISNFDASSFFTLHDFNNDGLWTEDEIRRTYGLDDVSLKDTPEQTKNDGVQKVMALFDPDGTGQITRPQFLKHIKDGKTLPDLGLGPGHHGDMEYEYEIHHFEKFHGPDTTEEDLIHPEDIEHFKMHDMMEDEQERIALEQSQSIVEANIPLKFRKQQ